MSQPAVSVIIPVRNGEATIRQCLDSILGQEYPKDRYELIVVDNGSTDRTAEIAGRYPVVLLEEKKRGQATARNRGLGRAKGEIVAFTDADCVAEAQWLRELVKPFADPGVGGVGGTIESTSRATAPERYAESRRLISHRFDLPWFLPYLVTGNAAYRKNLIDAVGGFDVELSPAGDDVDLSWRVLLEASCRFAPAEKAVVYHRHANTLSGLLSQCAKYHSTYHKLFVRHGHHDSFPRRKLRDTLILYWNLLLRLPKDFALALLGWLGGRRSRDEMLFGLYDWLRCLCIAWCRMKLTMAHRRYYI